MAKTASTTNKLDWSVIDFNNPEVQTIIKKMFDDIGFIRDQALVEIKELSRERRGIIEQIEKRADDDKIQAILKNIK